MASTISGAAARVSAPTTTTAYAASHGCHRPPRLLLLLPSRLGPQQAYYYPQPAAGACHRRRLWISSSSSSSSSSFAPLHRDRDRRRRVMAPQSSLSAVTTTTISSASSPSASPALTSPWIAAHPSKSRSWSSSSWSALSSSSSSSSSTAELRHRDQRLLPYSQKQLFDLISDVNNYHLFVPWCVSSRVLSRKTITIPGPPSTLTSKATAPPITKTLMRAELGVGFQAANENYISDVICVHSSKIQAVASNSAVFKTLTTTWSLTPQAGPKPTSKAPLTKGPVRQHPHPASKLACPTPAPLARSAVERPSSPAAAKPAPASDLVSSDLPYCMVDFSIAFEFRSALYSGLAQLFMTEVSQQMVRAFEERARAVYGGGGNRSFGLDRRS